jgi:hypothetical protein
MVLKFDKISNDCYASAYANAIRARGIGAPFLNLIPNQ